MGAKFKAFSSFLLFSDKKVHCDMLYHSLPVPYLQIVYAVLRT